MSKLLELALRNRYAVYLDTINDIEVPFDQLDLCAGQLQRSTRKLAFLYIDNLIDSIRIFWSFMASEHVMALLSPQLNPSFKQQLEDQYKPDFIYDPGRERIANFENIGKDWLSHLFFYRESGIRDLHPKLKLLLSTSGTTGSPKFVKLSEENLVQNALSISDYLPIVKDDVAPLNLPIYYSYGLSILTTNTISGGKVACTDKDVLNKKFWEEFRRYGYTTFAGVPYVYEMLYRIGFTKKSYPSLRYITQAGGKLNKKLVEIFRDYSEQQGIKFYVMYGQTEASPRMSYLPPEYLADKVGSIGRPIKNGKFIIESETGELHYEGPNVFGGYATSWEDLKSYDETYHLATGDIVRVDDDGFYYIVGRLKRFVKLFGSRINLDEVESRLKSFFGGVSFACTGVNDKKLYVITNESSIDEDKVKKYLKSDLNIHPSYVIFETVPEMPLTQNGKIDYKAISSRYGS